MNAAKTVWVAGLVLVGLASASCGKDEGTGGDEDKGTVITGGSSGSAGAGSGGRVTGRGGSTGGSGGSNAATPATKLGRACVSDKDCLDPKAPGLACITAKDEVLGDGAPPKGLCTAPCAADDECAPFGAGAVCFPFAPGAQGAYCVEGCAFGEPDLGQAKCHSRPEFACNPALLQETNSACKVSADCQAGELCSNGVCDVVIPACLPACRGDLDCESGMYCDQSFLSGVCVSQKPTGKALGDSCTVVPDGQAAEPDGCLGFCQADAANSNKGHCAATCGLARQCAWNAGTQKFDGVCFYASVLTSDTGDVGDFGFCTPTCNCSGDCQDPTLSCSLLSQGALSSDFRGAGLCFSPSKDTVEYDQCSGSAGAGGADSMGAAGAPGGGGARP